jgi:hypothetical protein
MLRRGKKLWVSGPSFLVGPPVSGSPATLFAASPALNLDDANPLTSFRVVIPLSGSTLTKIRATLHPGVDWTNGSQYLSILHASIGKWDGSIYPNTTSTPIELKFGGASGFSGATTPQTSDWADLGGLSVTSSDKLVVIYDIADIPAALQRYNNAATGVTTFFHASTQSWNVADVTASGYTQLDSVNYCIDSVETQ